MARRSRASSPRSRRVRRRPARSAPTTARRDTMARLRSAIRRYRSVCSSLERELRVERGIPPRGRRAPRCGRRPHHRAVAGLEGVELGVAVGRERGLELCSLSQMAPPAVTTARAANTRRRMGGAESRASPPKRLSWPGVQALQSPAGGAFSPRPGPWTGPGRLRAPGRGASPHGPRVGEVHHLGGCPGAGAPLRAPALPGGCAGRHRRRESAGPGGHAGAGARSSGKLHARTLDVSQEPDVRAFVEWAHASMGGLNAVINNAGILRDGLLVKKDRHTGAVRCSPRTSGTRCWR